MIPVLEISHFQPSEFVIVIATMSRGGTLKAQSQDYHV